MTASPTLLFANNSTTFLASSISNSDTVIPLVTGGGALFPSPGAGQAFIATLVDSNTGLLTEIVKCTARSGDSVTVTRAQEGTTARNWSAGDVFAMFPTAGTMTSLAQLIQLQQQATNYAIDTGAANFITVTLTPDPGSSTALIGAPVRVKVAHTNTSIGVTLSVNGIGWGVKLPDGNAPGVGVLVAGGIYEFVFDGVDAYRLTSGALVGSNSGSGASASGWTIYPNGTIVQWGKLTATDSGSGILINLPIAFRTAYTVSVDVGSNSSSEINIANGSTTNLAQITIFAWTWTGSGWSSAVSKGFGWIAVGY